MLARRYYSIDMIRGITVISMVLYHLLYDLKYMFFLNMGFFSIENSYIWQQSICITFIVIAGISLNFNHKKLNHAIKLLLISIIISVVTHVFMRDFAIYFGIIHFLAFGIIFISLFVRVLDKIPALIGFIINLAIFILLRTNFYKLSVFHIKLNSILSSLKFGFIFGFPDSSFSSSDYFPIFPWIFLLITGYYLGKIINFNKILNISKKNFLVTIGQNSLIIYLSHQIIIYSFLSILLR